MQASRTPQSYVLPPNTDEPAVLLPNCAVPKPADTVYKLRDDSIGREKK